MSYPVRTLLALAVAVAAGCAAAPRPAQAPPDSPPAAAPASDRERLSRYDDLKNAATGTPYVTMWYHDSRQDKLVVGVGTVEAKQAVQREMIRLGLPEGSVLFEQPKLLLSEAAPFDGCQASPPQPADGDGRLVIPPVMRPGQTFELSVKLAASAQEITRGVDSYLDCWDGTQWSERFMLMVGFSSPDAPPSARISGINAVVSLGLIGPGPEKLVLPDEIPPGWYRIRKHVVVGTTGYDLTAPVEVRGR